MGSYQAPTTVPQPSVQSKQQDLGFGGQVCSKHSPGAAGVLQGLWYPECEQGPKMESPRVGEIWAEEAMGHLSWTTHLPTQAGSLITGHAQWLSLAASLSHCSASCMNLRLVRSQNGVSSLWVQLLLIPCFGYSSWKAVRARHNAKDSACMFPFPPISPVR